MAEPVFITGLGMISAIGDDVAGSFSSLTGSRSGIGTITLLDTLHKGSIPMAEVKHTNDELLEMAGFPCARNLTRTALLGIIAAKEAISAAGIQDIRECRTGLVSATTVGGMDRSENFYAGFIDDEKKGRLMDVVNHDCADSTERIAGVMGIRDMVTTISTACSSSVNAIMYACNLIRTGRADRVIAGGTDAVTRFTLNGFNTLMILDKGGCRPFDEHRNGLTLGEGAAFLVLESAREVERTKKKCFAMVRGYANANDAFHQTASSPDGKGAYLAMSGALQMAGLDPSQIDYVNVHGTGTQNNDLSEGIAMERLFGGAVPHFSSTKAFTGHTLGAAGAVEAVISVLSIRNKMIFPNLNFTTPMKELQIRPVTSLETGKDIRHVLSNSFGFGGNNSSVVISDIE